MIICDRCREQVKEERPTVTGERSDGPGDNYSEIFKVHLCAGCEKDLLDWLKPEAADV